MVKYQSQILRGLVTATSLLLLVCLMVPGPILGQTPRVAGELSAVKQATINGVEAISGLTVFSGNRIKTTSQGLATINLGTRGRIELGGDTEMAMRFSSDSVGGELRGGRAVLSAPMGISVSLSTIEGLVMSDGKQASVLTVEAIGNRVRVAASRGTVKIISPTKTELITPGDEVIIGSQTQDRGWQHRRILTAGALGAGGVVAASQVAAPAGALAITPAKVTTLSGLVNASLGYSVKNVTRVNLKDRDPEHFFSTSITCRDHESIVCHRRSSVTP